MTARVPIYPTMRPVYVMIGNAQVIMAPLPGVKARHPRTAQKDCIRLNNAPKQTLIRLVHIGQVRAQAIIEGHPWPSAAALIAIDGIGDARLADIRHQGLLCKK